MSQICPGSGPRGEIVTKPEPARSCGWVIDTELRTVAVGHLRKEGGSFDTNGFLGIADRTAAYGESHPDVDSTTDTSSWTKSSQSSHSPCKISIPDVLLSDGLQMNGEDR